jgi:alkylation response protein AidB-like acyl-CoA dehydrogenase
MDFNDTPEEAEFRAKARAFLDANAELKGPEDAAESVIERDDPETIRAAQAWQAKKFDNDFACITWPKEFGGRGGTPIQSVVWNQEEGRYKTPPNIFVIGIGMLGPTIMTHGTPEQKERYLPKMARGDEVWCQLFSEPAAGSDLAGLRMSAVKDGDEWVLNGQKIWTTGAHYSRWGMLPVRSDPNVAKHAGMTYFIVDMEAKGIEIRPIKQINGASHFTEVFFSDVRVPDSYRVGAVGDGWRVAITTLMHERAAVGAGARTGPGIDDLIRLAQEVELNGRPAIEDAGVRQRIADFHVQMAGLRCTGYRTLTAISRGQTPGPEASIMKLIGAALMQKVASCGIDLQGLAGSVVDEEGGWQDAYLQSAGLRLAGGSDEILLNIIAERVLRLPPEPRVDKDLAFRDIPTGPPSK